MCGIFGLVGGENHILSYNLVKLVMDNLFQLSESRGKEASGLSIQSGNNISILKCAIPASRFIKQSVYKDIYKNLLSEDLPSTNKNNNYPICAIGHSRLVTNGGQQIHQNNQPVISEGLVGIHNGIVTNVDLLLSKFPSINMKYQVDTEIILKLIRLFYIENECIMTSVRKVFELIEGACSIAVQFNDLNILLLATNNGSLYMLYNNKYHTCIFASENYILQLLKNKRKLHNFISKFEIKHIEAGTACLINLNSLRLTNFSLISKDIYPDLQLSDLKISQTIEDISPIEKTVTEPLRISGEGPYILPNLFIDRYPQAKVAVSRLRRCTNCLLPETMPFIQFNKNGVCNYCLNYKKMKPLGLNALKEAVKPYQKKNGEPECLIAFSGGRDSSYGVHFVKKILNMNPVTYAYDWGMVTDLARRNQMRMCGSLGIEHILVSADINKKRKNIKRNVEAWLSKPDLGTIPLFMAGDKQYFYYANKIAKQVGSKAIILCENPLETTRFKSGFCGVAPDYDSRQTYKLALFDKFKLAGYYGAQYITNPRYINSSIIDTLEAYFSYYFIPHIYLDIYQYIKWNEDEINSTLINEYNWEIADDTKTTWRIGDGTAAFYNYIYYTMAGFTENDTFRSNQIREGIITRKEALKLVEQENEPRYKSIMWYCDVIGIDFEETITAINSAPKLYKSY